MNSIGTNIEILELKKDFQLPNEASLGCHTDITNEKRSCTTTTTFLEYKKNIYNKFPKHDTTFQVHDKQHCRDKVTYVRSFMHHEEITRMICPSVSNYEPQSFYHVQKQVPLKLAIAKGGFHK